MNSYQKVNRAFDLISIGTSAIITKGIIDWLQELKIQQLAILCLTFVLVYLLNEVFTGIFKKFFSNFEFFRKLILGEDFIEGTWIEFQTKDDGNLESVGIVKIKPERGGYGLTISGENFKYIQGNELSLNYRFSSKDGLVNLKFPILDFAYINRFSTPINGRQSFEGVAQVTFSDVQRISSHYHMSFYLSEDGKTMNVQGHKIKSYNDLKTIKNDTMKLFETDIFKKYNIS